MLTTLNEPFPINEYPEYWPVIRCVFILLFQAKRKGRIGHIGKIDDIFSSLFNVNTTYASKFRKLYSRRLKGIDDPELYDECMNHIKIGHFNSKRMISTYSSLIPNDSLRGLLLLSNYAIPVSNILNESGKYEIHADFKREIKSWTSEIDKIMQGNPNLKAAIYMYLHQFRENELVWWLLATLPSIGKAKIEEWIHVFDAIHPEKSILEIIRLTEKWLFLLDFKNKLPRLNASNLKNVYDNVTGYDLQCAYFHIDYFKQLSRTPLRQDDIYLTYLIISTLEEWPQELMIEQIASASKANLPIDFCPKDERLIDWGTQTAW